MSETETKPETKVETKTPKAQRTREHILATALALFAEKGYDETTMRDIAARADCSLGLAYRYFARKEEFILALYERCAVELEEEVARLPPGPLARRFAQAMEADLRRMGEHRATMGTLFAAGLAPDSPVAVLGEGVAGIRERTWGIFRTVVAGASDAPRPKQIGADHDAVLRRAPAPGAVLAPGPQSGPGQDARTAQLRRRDDRTPAARARPAASRQTARPTRPDRRSHVWTIRDASWGNRAASRTGAWGARFARVFSNGVNSSSSRAASAIARVRPSRPARGGSVRGADSAGVRCAFRTAAEAQARAGPGGQTR